MPLSNGHGKEPRFFSKLALSAMLSAFNNTLSDLAGAVVFTGVIGTDFTGVLGLSPVEDFSAFSASFLNLSFSAAAFAMASFLASS